jgi:large subunit ribosomal protein L5
MQRDNRLNKLPPVPRGAAEEETPLENSEKPASQDVESKKPAAKKAAVKKPAAKKAVAKKAVAKKPAAKKAVAKKPAAKKNEGTVSSVYRPRLYTQYKDEIMGLLVKELGYGNIMEVPSITKIVVNIGAGEAKEEARALEGIQKDLTDIVGQKPVVTRAKKAIAGFKIRENQPIGAAVTLRGNRMWEFLDRLMNIALPRTRDFRGLSLKGFDGRGDYTLGLTEQIIFPEIDFNRIDRIRGLQVSIVTSASTDQEGYKLLELLGMPFVKQGEV